MRRFTLKQLFATIAVAAIGIGIACASPPRDVRDYLGQLASLTGLPLFGAAIGSLLRYPITCAIVGAVIGFYFHWQLFLTYYRTY
jgi:hypothetical protein